MVNSILYSFFLYFLNEGLFFNSIQNYSSSGISDTTKEISISVLEKSFVLNEVVFDYIQNNSIKYNPKKFIFINIELLKGEDLKEKSLETINFDNYFEDEIFVSLITISTEDSYLCYISDNLESLYFYKFSDFNIIVKSDELKIKERPSSLKATIKVNCDSIFIMDNAFIMDTNEKIYKIKNGKVWRLISNM
jgi:hypothetical protein